MEKIKEVNKICEEQGHDFETYVYEPELVSCSADYEQAGKCKRCGYDTHKD